MTLSPGDVQLYYSLWMPLLDYVNKEYHVSSKQTTFTSPQDSAPKEVKKVADRLWEDADSIIDEYLKEKNTLPDEHREIIRGWKRRIRGKFLLERHLKKGSIFISTEDHEVYQVSGIKTSWEETLAGMNAPLFIEVTLIPFKGLIIYDGIALPYVNVSMGGGLKRRYKDIYW